MVQNCEKCLVVHDGSYGSGRFCSSKCARGFSTKNKREEINGKVSKKLLERNTKNFPYVSPEARKRQGEAQSKIYQEKLLKEDFITLSWSRKKKVILLEQEGKCCICGVSEWMGRSISLHLDHVDGDRANNSRTNLRCVCPNCHSQTVTYCGRNTTKFQSLSDEHILAVLLSSSSICKAIQKLGLNISGNTYRRCRKVLDNFSNEKTGLIV